MTVSVFDTYAIAVLDGAFVEREMVSAFAYLTERVERGQLTFPDEVHKDAKTFLGPSHAGVWAAACASARVQSAFPGSTPMAVLGLCPSLLDPEDAGSQSHVEVACLAHHLQTEGHDVQVVTDDLGVGGRRKSLGEACGDLGIPHVTCRAYLQRCGMAPSWLI